VAKNNAAHRALAGQWQRHEVEKRYLALVRGYPEPPEGEISGSIGRDPRFRQRMAVVEGGRGAHTRYRTLERLIGWTLVEAHPVTGRTHQIRVHFASSGHPIAGYATYGGRTPLLSRQFLHAARLRFRHPRSDEWVELRSSLPRDLRDVLAALGSTSTDAKNVAWHSTIGEL
jgi:23S rRNA pseudouridine1911/1915/1917 synthase